MADKIKLRAGSKAKIPTLAEREMWYCKDENAIYVGTEDGNKKVGGDGVTEQDKQDIIDGVLDGIQGGSYEQGVEDGKKAEYDRFWDLYQDYGNRTRYERAFAGVGWTDETFKPKYKITVGTSAYMMFANSQITEITRDVVDFSKTATFNYTFYYDNAFKRIEIDCSSAEKLSDSFYGGTITDIVLFNVTEKLIFERTFNGNGNKFSSLVNLSISGVIGTDGLDVKYCTNLSEASGLSIINALSTTTSGLTVTLPTAWKTTYIANHGQTAFDNLMATKSNWTIDFK